MGDSYCSGLKREYNFSDWQKHLPFKNFLKGKEAYNYYYKNPDAAFRDTYIGDEKDSVMWARIYSEDVLRSNYEPIPDFMVLDKIELARENGNQEQFWALLFGFGISQWLSADKGYGGAGGARSAYDILMPGGKPVGRVGANGVMTVQSEAELHRLVNELTIDATIVTKSNYSGTWYQLSSGGGVGIRTSKNWGLTIDLDIESLPFNKIHLPK